MRSRSSRAAPRTHTCWLPPRWPPWSAGSRWTTGGRATERRPRKRGDPPQRLELALQQPRGRRGRVEPARHDFVEQFLNRAVLPDRLLEPPPEPDRRELEHLVAEVPASPLLERPLRPDVLAVLLELLDQLVDALAAR